MGRFLAHSGELQRLNPCYEIVRCDIDRAVIIRSAARASLLQDRFVLFLRILVLKRLQSLLDGVLLFFYAVESLPNLILAVQNGG